ncbi:hypothetical protein UlMin_000689 [Ulmus minor]
MFNKELLSWYLITLELRNYQIQQNIQKQQQEPSESLQIVVVNGDVSFEKGLKSPNSEWVISIREKLEQACQDDVAGTWEKLFIYRVPYYFREGDDKAYFPQIEMPPQKDHNKWCSLHHVLKRTNHDISLYLKSIKELEEKARSCYEGPINLSSNEFVEMMVLDGCFVLELFRYPRNDPIFATCGYMHSIQRDMIMLENQIPLFILDRFLGLQLGDPDHRGFVAKLAVQFFDPLMPIDKPLTKSDRNKLESSLGYTTTFDPLFDQSGLHCLDTCLGRVWLFLACKFLCLDAWKNTSIYRKINESWIP